VFAKEMRTRAAFKEPKKSKKAYEHDVRYLLLMYNDLSGIVFCYFVHWRPWERTLSGQKIMCVFICSSLSAYGVRMVVPWPSAPSAPPPTMRSALG
jgi:hypothetical protein